MKNKNLPSAKKTNLTNCHCTAIKLSVSNNHKAKWIGATILWKQRFELRKQTRKVKTNKIF